MTCTSPYDRVPALGPRDLLILCIRGLPHTVSNTVMHAGRTGACAFAVIRRFSMRIDEEVKTELERIRNRRRA
jgi:hypothetical protein